MALPPTKMYKKWPDKESFSYFYAGHFLYINVGAHFLESMDNKSKRRLEQLIFAVIVSLTGCNYADPVLEKEYLKALSTYDIPLVDHFPKRITYLYSTLHHSQDKIHSHPGIWLKTKMDSDKLDSLVQVGSSL